MSNYNFGELDISETPAFLEEKAELIAENMSDELLIYEAPVMLKPLLARRRIKVCENPKLQSVGHIKYLEDGFLLEYNNFLQLSSHYVRFLIAHEIAHTYFFDIEGRSPRMLFDFRQDEPKIEKTCDYLGRCILSPRKLLLHYLKQIPNPVDASFSAQNIIRAKTHFKMREEKLLTRIVCDLEAWNFFVFKFVFVEFIHRKTGRQKGWKMRDFYIPKNFMGQIGFIPRGKMKYDGKIYNFSLLASAKGGILELLNSLDVSKRKADSRIQWNDYPIEVLKSIDGLYKFFQNKDIVKIGVANDIFYNTPMAYLFIKIV